MYAVSAGSMDIIATLVGYFLVVNHQIDKRNLVGMTPLLLAAKMGRYVPEHVYLSTFCLENVAIYSGFVWGSVFPIC